MTRRPTHAEELDLVPIMNLVSILIPFLLMASSFVTLAVVDVSLPQIGPHPDPASDEPQPVRVRITDAGFEIVGDGEPVAIGCLLAGCPSPADYDTEGLAAALGRIKDRMPEQEQVIVAPGGDVPYEVLIAAFDAARGPADRVLFPQVSIAGGVE